jgi:LmbE family N-acetylglucosaminyl deacetylase
VLRHVELLGHADSGFDGPLPEGALCATDVTVLADRLAARLAELDAHTVVVLDGGDGHRDHLHVRAAVEAAIATGRMTRRPRLVQSCLPNSLMRRWVAEMHAHASDAAHLSIDLDALGTADELLTALDARHVLARREAAIACHRSQASPFDTLSPELRAAFLSVDHVRAVRPGT